jgi:hypothetical protein
MPSPAVTEDGQPLGLAPASRHSNPVSISSGATRSISRATDDSDPRENGRTYAVLMPECAAYIEQLPLHEILEHGL